MYLGHIIYEEGIAMDLEKILVIMEWPTPKDVSDMRYFMGLEEYYRRFIKGLFKSAHSITSLQWKNIKFVCLEKFEASFQ